MFHSYFEIQPPINKHTVMMNGDSSPNVELIYEMRATRCMIDKGVQFTPECLEESVSDTQPIQELNHNISSPARNVPVRRSIEQEEAIESADEPAEKTTPQAKVALESLEAIESDPDNVDAKWLPLPPSQEDDDGCGVQCLSLMVQCCECVIL